MLKVASVACNDFACLVHFAEIDSNRSLQFLDIFGATKRKAQKLPVVFFARACSTSSLQSRSLRSGYSPTIRRYPVWISMTLKLLISLDRNAKNYHVCPQFNTVQTQRHVQRAWASGLRSEGDSSSASSTPCPHSEILLQTEFTNTQPAHNVARVPWRSKPKGKSMKSYLMLFVSISCFADQGSMTYRIPEMVIEVSAMLVARTILRHLADTPVQWHWECCWIRAICKMLARPQTLEGSAETPAPPEVRNILCLEPNLDQGACTTLSLAWLALPACWSNGKEE